MEPNISFATSPSTASNDACSLHSGARDHDLRSACDFCHEKRIKCVLIEGQSRCLQCKRRNTEACNFSVKHEIQVEDCSAKGRACSTEDPTAMRRLRTKGPKPKRSRPKPDTSCYKRRKTTPGSRLEMIHSSVVVADPSAPNENQSTTRPLPTLVASTNQQQGTGYLQGSPGNVFGQNPTKLGSTPPCDWDIIWRNEKRPWGVQQSMSPSRLSLFSSPAGGVAAGGKTSSSPLRRPYEQRDCKWQEGDLGSCYGGGGSNDDVGVDGMAAPCGNLGSNRVQDVDTFLRDEDTFEFILKVEAMLEAIDAESASNAGVAKEGVSVREPSNAANEFGKAVGEVGTRLPGNIQDVSCLLSESKASPAPLGASDSDAAGVMPKESHLERLKIIGSNPWGLHGDIYRGSGRL